MNKHNALIRMILYSITTLILLALFIGGITGKLWNENHFSIAGLDVHLGGSMDTSGTVSTSGTVEAAEIKVIHVQWAAGTITIEPADVEEIQFREEGSFHEENSMLWKQTGKTLNIQHAKPKVFLGISYPGPAKDLTILVPRNWTGGNLRIEAASADVELKNLTLNEVEFDGASGTLNLDSCDLHSLDVDTASGNVHFLGTLQELDCDAASANITAVLHNVPKSIDLDTVSGDLDLTLPKNSGFRLTLDTLNGDFFSDFPTTSKGKTYICGDGKCEIEVDGMSGDVRIREGS